MKNTILSYGPFMVILLALAIVNIIYTYYSFKTPKYKNGIIYLGSLSALIGIVATNRGINSMFNAINYMSDISPIILLEGITMALATTYLGGFILVISILIWYIINKKKY